MPLITRLLPRLSRLPSVLVGLAICSAAQADPLLRCKAIYGDDTQIMETRLTQDPYTVKAVDIGGRFRFKAVMIGKHDTIDYIKLYAYFQRPGKDLPIHQAVYLPPFHLTSESTNLTPLNYLYAGNLERELQYQCSLQQVRP